MKRIFEKMPDIEWPKLTRDVPIDVYLVHNSAEAEDYFFHFDFEEFADRSRSGMFVKPMLQVHAGRDDFSRVTFARQFREVFATEFDRMRAELGQGEEKRGWLTWEWAIFGGITGLIGNLVLAIALSAGKSLLSQISMPKFLKGKSAEAKLADEIDKTKSQVEQALQRIDVALHPELAAHARAQGHGRASGLDRDAWPLPDYVRAHLTDGRSGSWW